MPETFSMPDTVLGESLRFGERFSATRRQKVVFAPTPIAFLGREPRLAQKFPATGRPRVLGSASRNLHRDSSRFGYEWRLGRLTGASYTGTAAQSDEAYAYDANGNRQSANGSSYVIGADNRLISDGTYTYSCDAEGNRTAKFIDANADGVLDTGDTQRYCQ